MNEAAIAAVIIELTRIATAHLGKPKDWKPSPEDVRDFLMQIDEATPENLKAQARLRLGIS